MKYLRGDVRGQRGQREAETGLRGAGMMLEEAAMGLRGAAGSQEPALD